MLRICLIASALFPCLVAGCAPHFFQLRKPLAKIVTHPVTVVPDGSSHHLASARPIRVVCYNIAHGRGLAESNWDGGDSAERTTRLDQIAALLGQLDADVVVLNEVDFDSSWSGSVNQAQYLARKAGYAHYVEQRNFDARAFTWKWRFGNAILSKHPITDSRVVDLPGYSFWETSLAGKKRAVACEITIGRQTICLVGAHFSHRSEALRVESARMLADLASQNRWPTIIAGDLNSTPPGFPRSKTDSDGNNAIATLDRCGLFGRLPTNPDVTSSELTFHSAKPDRVIDWILIPHRWRFLHYQVVSSQLSDHRPVLADIVLGPPLDAAVSGSPCLLGAPASRHVPPASP